MKRADTVQRYQRFLNDVIESIRVGILPTMQFMVKKYGISAGFPTFLAHTGVIKRKSDSSRHPGYYVDKDTPSHYTEEQAAVLCKEFNVWAWNKRKNGGKEVPLVKAESTFSDITTQQLISELRRRGYNGNLYIKKEIKV